MAARNGPGGPAVTHFDRLSAAPGTYHIFHALRVIEAQFPDAPPLGESKRPREDRVRLGQAPSLSFPPVTIDAFRPPEGGRPGVLTNRFFGLFGPQGPLPTHLTEYARERQINRRDATFTAFADMLTHRMMSLLYRAWTTGQPAAGFERGAGGRVERKLAALAGLMGRQMADRDALPDLAKRHFTGALGRGPKNAEGLVAILSAYFRSAVRVEQFVGSWLDLEAGDRWQLGRGALGHDTSIGGRVWSRAAKFRLRIGPLPLEDYRRLLPGQASLARLTAIVRGYVGDALDWDVNLVLRADAVPQARLGESAQLGQTTWIGQRQSSRDADDLFVAPQLATPARPDAHEAHEEEGRP